MQDTSSNEKSVKKDTKEKWSNCIYCAAQLLDKEVSCWQRHTTINNQQAARQSAFTDHN